MFTACVGRGSLSVKLSKDVIKVVPASSCPSDYRSEVCHWDIVCLRPLSDFTKSDYLVIGRERPLLAPQYLICDM
jgi:hypothetical protein